MIVHAAVTGLLGEFDHEVTLEEDWDFAIAFGLNGVGKTKFLELINATINREFYALASVRFATLTLRSADGQELEVGRTVEEEGRDRSARIAVSLRGFVPSGDTLLDHVGWSHVVPLNFDEELSAFLIRNTTWTPLEGTLWEDRSDGDIADIEELRRVYGSAVQQRKQPRNPPPDLPPEIEAFFSGNTTYLIETQRLGTRAVARANTRGYAARSQATPRWTVDGYSSDLKSRLQNALADNSLRSQRLDRSFPRRVLDENHPFKSEDEIRVEFSELDELRQRLSDIGLTTTDDVVPLPAQGLKDWQQRVLTMYIDDTRAKLSTFDDLRQKIDLLEELVNERFLRKRIDVSVDEGLSIYSTTDGTSIPASGLSSGEQHELVLIYNLLFRVARGSLVMIDEPEISLHVSWQKKFLDDLLRIAESSQLKFIVATHSPTIIGKWWSRTVRLGPSDPDDGGPQDAIRD